MDSYCSETSTTDWNASASSQAPESPKVLPQSPKLLPQTGAAGLLRSTTAWHVLDASKDLDLAARCAHVPAAAKAVVILGDHDRAQPVREALRHVAEARGGPRVPVVVLLTFCPLDDADVLAVVSTQRDLCARGADDVALAAAGDPISLRALVSMSIARAEMRLAAIEAARKEAAADAACGSSGVARVRSEPHPPRRSSFGLDADQRCKPKAVMQWVVGRLFESLPKVAGTLPEKPERVGSWVLERPLGEGGFGKVWMGTNSATGEQEALKLVPKELLNSAERACSAWAEIQVLGRLEHRHIVQFKGALHCDSHLCIRMGVAGRNMLRAMVTAGGRFRMDVAKRFLGQLSSALAYCHREGVAHRDIKPENVGVSDDGKRIKLLDFGCATDLHGMCEDVAGTMPFMAPEVIDMDEEEPYSPAGMDVWASGVLLLEMLCGCGKLNRMLGWGKTVRPTKVRKQELDVFFGIPGCLEQALEDDVGPVDPSLVELLSGMLEVNMLRRLSASAVQASPWLKGRAAS